MPALPTARNAPTDAHGVLFATGGHHFTAPAELDVVAAAEAAAGPLSVILQVTKRCNFDCSFCSEVLQMPDPTLDELADIRDNLAGVARVFLSGGEPMMRRDFGDVVDIFHDRGHVLAVPTNATYGLDHAARIAGKVAFMNIGLEGPRATTNRVRGNYDQVMAGVRALLDAGLPVSMSAVVYRSTLAALPFTYQIADLLGAGKLKLILPLRKGNALDLDEHEFISEAEAAETFGRLSELRATHEWTPALRLTTWTKDNEGHMIVIEPNGIARAWPVYDAPDLWEHLGNVREEPIAEIWKRYPYKANHYRKYLGRSIRATENTGGRHA
jgi:MoaA/NifB/PqqE/SkfB family radical SAM enzyme